MKKLILVAAFSGVAAGAASAEPGLAGEIYEPTVARGESELEFRGGILNGGDAGGEWQIKAEASHAFTDWWRPGLVAEWEYEGGSAEFTAFAVENVFDFTATRDWPVHLGGYVEYEFAEDSPDSVELKLLMSRQRGPIYVRVNLIGERALSNNADGWEYGYAVQAGYAFNDDIELGLQGFGDAGAHDELGELEDRAHYWGPFAQFEVGELGRGEAELQLGYLVGFGEAEADGQFRLKLGYEFGVDN